MNQRFRVLFFSSVVLMAFIGFAGIGAAENYAAPGPYLVIAGLTGFEDFQNTGVDDFKDAWGLNMRVGQRFNANVALEGDLAMMNGYDATIDLAQVDPSLSGTDKVSLDALTLTANLKAHLPLGRLDPYALIGAGIMYANLRTGYPVGYVCRPGYYGWYCSGAYASIDDATAFVTKFGLGADIHINREWAVTLDASYVVPYSKLSDLRYTQLAWGVRISF